MNNGIEVIMQVIERFTYITKADTTNLTTIIQMGEIDEDGFGFIKCTIGDHSRAGTGLSLWIINSPFEVDSAGLPNIPRKE